MSKKDDTKSSVVFSQKEITTIRNGKASTKTVITNGQTSTRILGKPSHKSLSGGSVFRLIILLLLVIVVGQVLFGVAPERRMTVSGLLNAFTSDNARRVYIDTSWIVRFHDSYIQGDWGLFDFLRNFINNYIISIVSVLLYIVVGLAQAIVFVGYFFGVFFGVV